MSSEIQKVHIQTENNRRDSSYAIGETTNPSSLNFSIAQIQSVYPDRSTCDILLIPSNQFRQEVPSIIPTALLNIVGHLNNDDYVLISHKGDDRECRIVQKLQNINKEVAKDDSFKRNCKVTWGVFSA